MDQNWYQGRLDGQIGLVPVNYISIVQSLPKQDSQDDIEQSVRVGCEGWAVRVGGSVDNVRGGY